MHNLIKNASFIVNYIWSKSYIFRLNFHLYLLQLIKLSASVNFRAVGGTKVRTGNNNFYDIAARAARDAPTP